MERPLIIAHRGASGHAPEHTFAAWDRALEIGADFIEQDLQMTADGALVVMHDVTLDRTTDGVGPVSAMSQEEIGHLDAGSWFSPRFRGERIPTLAAVFERYRDGAAFYVETKQPEDAPGMEAALVRAIDEAGLRNAAADGWRVLVQSFSDASLRIMADLAPDIPLVRLLRLEDLERISPNVLSAIAQYAVGVGPDHRGVDLDFVTAAHDLGLHVHPWTVNEPATLRAMIELDVDGIFTDYPDRLRDLLDHRSIIGPEAVRQSASEWRKHRSTGGFVQ